MKDANLLFKVSFVAVRTPASMPFDNVNQRHIRPKTALPWQVTLEGAVYFATVGTPIVSIQWN